MLLLKKLFNRIRQVNWNIILLELFIVFIGVYLAFLLNQYQDRQRIAEEADKIYTSLKVELERIRLDFPGRAAYQRQINVEWDTLWEKGLYGSFYEWRYIQPQYDFTTLEYALKTQESSIVDFELYQSLTQLYREVKKLEHQELLITDIGMQYRNVPSELLLTEQELAARHADNRMLFYKFRDLTHLRAEALDRMAQLAQEGLTILNAKLGRKKQKEIERSLLREHLPRLLPQQGVPDEKVVATIQASFPAFSEKEIQGIVAELRREQED